MLRAAWQRGVLAQRRELARGALLAARGLALRRGFAALPPHTTLTLPALSPTMTEGTIANWLKGEGDAVAPGQPICEVETDKATVDFEVQENGFLARILAKAGSGARPVGAVIGIMVEDKADIAAFADVTVEQLSGAAPKAAAAAAPAPKAAPAPAAAAKPAAQPAPPPAPPAPRATGARVFASPLARVIAAQANVALEGIVGTGPNGRIVRADVDEFVAANRGQVAAARPAAPAGVATATAAAAAPAPAAPALGAFDTPVSLHAQQVAAALERSKREVPHYYLNAEVDVTALMALRAQLNSSLKAEEHVSLNDCIVRAAALAMQRVPDVNASWGKTFIRRFADVDINVAVVDEADEALAMPVVRKANAKGLASIAKETRAMLQPGGLAKADLGLGTFTVTNLGAYGVSSFSPIVREPQACSLGVGRVAKRAVPGDADKEGRVQVKVRESMTVTLSCDHRVVDGAVGAQWLQEFKALLENPLTMLL